MTDVRYGIFLRPDPATCLAVTQVTFALRQQYGLVSAAAFPPHVTLIGNLRSRVSENDLVAKLDEVMQQVSAFPVYNSGVKRTREGTFRYDLNADSSGQYPNRVLADVAAKVKNALAPRHLQHEDRLAPNVDDYEFHAHLSLANFELQIDNRLCDEVGEFIAGLPIVPPASFVACWYSLFEFRADWSGDWWENMPWRHIRSWEAPTRSPLNADRKTS